MTYDITHEVCEPTLFEDSGFRDRDGHMLSTPIRYKPRHPEWLTSLIVCCDTMMLFSCKYKQHTHTHTQVALAVKLLSSNDSCLLAYTHRRQVYVIHHLIVQT